MAESRQRKPRGSLSPAAVIEAAERVASRHGFEALTMRAVAAELDSAPMALYRHFGTKELLVNALLDSVLARFTPSPKTRSWREDLKSFARAHRGLLMEHRWAVPGLFTHPNPGPAATRIGELAFEILRRARLTDQQAVATFSGLIALNYGWSSFAITRTPGDDEAMRAALEAVPREAFSLTVELAAEMSDYASDRHYEIVLGQYVAGVKPDHAPRTARGPAA